MSLSLCEFLYSSLSSSLQCTYSQHFKMHLVSSPLKMRSQLLHLFKTDNIAFQKEDMIKNSEWKKITSSYLNFTIFTKDFLSGYNYNFVLNFCYQALTHTCTLEVCVGQSFPMYENVNAVYRKMC